jgi:hypothetical protein
VIAGFSDPTTVTIVQQNAGPSVTTVQWDPASWFFNVNLSDAECWVHAEPSPPATPPSGTPCGCFTQGPVCGLALVDHAWWYGCSAPILEAGVDYQSLYDCDGGVYTVQQACPGLCVTPNIFDAGGGCGP